MSALFSFVRYGWVPLLLVVLVPAIHLKFLALPFVLPQQAPLILLLAAVLFGVYFQLSRVVFTGVAILIGFCAVQLLSSGMSESPVWHSALILLALNIALITPISDRSLFSGFGIALVLVIVGEVALLFALLSNSFGSGLVWLGFDLYPLMPPWLQSLAGIFFGKLTVAQLSMTLAVSLVVVSAWVRPGYMSFGMLALVVLVAEVYTFGGASVELAVTTAGLLLLITALHMTYELAFRDELTGIPSRRAYDRYLLTLGRHYSIAVVDIDHFKKLNDRFGHQVGDQALRLVASKIDRHSGGRAFRYGGEEFVVIFRGKNTERAVCSLEKMREIIAAYPMQLRSAERPKASGARGRGRGSRGRQAIRTTVSIGLAASAEQLRSPVQVVAAADKALYKAKRSGRNRLCH